MARPVDDLDSLSPVPTRHDREFFSYTKCEDGKIAKRVGICNTGTPVEVVYDDGGVSINSYNEILSLGGLSTSNIVLYTVPVGKKIKLTRIDFSGENKAVYKIDINGSIEAKKRTWYTNYDGSIVFSELILVAGDIIKLIVENKTNSIADFNGNLQGKLLDA